MISSEDALIEPIFLRQWQVCFSINSINNSLLNPFEENLIHKVQELFNLLCYVTVNNTMSCSPLFSLGTTQKPQGENGVEDTDSPTNSAGND